MSPENGLKLTSIYPELFSNLHCSVPFALFYFECHDGWFELLKECITKIKEVCERDKLNIKVDQIKEKYGTLRFYVSEYTDAINDIVDEAERKSSETCEMCGSLGEIRKLPWITTLCDVCMDKRK